MPPEEKQQRTLQWTKIILSFVIGAIATAFTIGMAVSKYETTTHAEQTYLRRDLYDSQREDTKAQLNRIESMVHELTQTKQDKGK